MTIDEMIAVLQAAKEGKVIQMRRSDTIDKHKWLDTKRPLWDFYHHDYRVKPETLRYKVALLRYTDGVTFPLICNTDADCRRVESYCAFVRWLTDWQEVEV